MAQQKSIDERIEILQQRKARLELEEKKLKARKSEKERKARTKRLIEIGGAVESVLGKPINREDLPLLIEFLKTQEERGQYFSKAMCVTNGLDRIITEKEKQAKQDTK